MFYLAAKTLASVVPEEDVQQGKCYPGISNIREVSKAIAIEGTILCFLFLSFSLSSLGLFPSLCLILVLSLFSFSLFLSTSTHRQLFSSLLSLTYTFSITTVCKVAFESRLAQIPAPSSEKELAQLVEQSMYTPEYAPLVMAPHHYRHTHDQDPYDNYIA